MLLYHRNVRFARFHGKTSVNSSSDESVAGFVGRLYLSHGGAARTVGGNDCRFELVPISSTGSDLLAHV